MARITITRQWPDGDVLSVSVKAESNYPDALAQALRTVTDAYREALGITVSDEP
jgi:hypothetical protein